MKWIILIVGGAAGTGARYILSGAVQHIFGASFPYGTAAVNMAGCFIVGVLAVLAEDKALLGPHARIFLMVGFCGAFTTFSTFILETSHLIRGGETLHAFWNVTGSVIIGFLLLRLGVLAGEAL
ncbi:MAG: fluoride efflux transporter CrcB [Candidatus Omnitrophota bacterium]|nr:fluoride efflux transporter CrcB [Candidatus Omnitrophota bacterium]